MEWKTDLIESIREERRAFKDLGAKELEKGLELSKTVKEGDRPEMTMDETDLVALSFYYAYFAAHQRDRMARGENVLMSEFDGRAILVNHP